MAGLDDLSGTVFFTGRADQDGNKLPVPQEIVELWEDVSRQ